MPGKHFITDPEMLVDGMCRSLLAQNPNLKYDVQHKVIFLGSIGSERSERVTLISGGGSGHEPAHGGYVGHGMLDAAVCGAVFASPNVRQILQGLYHISSPKGTIIIVKNYTGDKLNFGLAAEEYQARTGIPIKVVMVGDDVSVPRSRGGKVGRRGLAGAVFVHKIAGAAASQNCSLEEISMIAQHVADNVGTIGVSLDYCNIPSQQELAALPEGCIELGMGIHNEPGTKKLSPQPDIRTLVDSMLKYLLDSADDERGFLQFQSDPQSSKLVVLINNLGGLSVLELHAIAHVVLERLLAVYHIEPMRLYVGTYLTSLDGPGFSISLLNVESRPDCPPQERLLSLLDTSCKAPGWDKCLLSGRSQPVVVEDAIVTDVEETKPLKVMEIPCDGSFLRLVIQNIHQEIVKREPDITRFDTLMGDGDCGTTLLSGAQAVLRVSQSAEINNLSHAMLQISTAVTNAMGGTSGALYGLFLNAFTASLQQLYTTENLLSLSLFAQCCQQALTTLQRFTSAREGSRTLMDAIIPFVRELSGASLENPNPTLAVARALQAAVSGMENTKNMKSFFGRSTYVGAGAGSDVGECEDPTWGIPDPGACGVVAICTGIVTAFQAST